MGLQANKCQLNGQVVESDDKIKSNLNEWAFLGPQA